MYEIMLIWWRLFFYGKHIANTFHQTCYLPCDEVLCSIRSTTFCIPAVFSSLASRLSTIKSMFWASLPFKIWSGRKWWVIMSPLSQEEFKDEYFVKSRYFSLMNQEYWEAMPLSLLLTCVFVWPFKMVLPLLWREYCLLGGRFNRPQIGASLFLIW